MGFGATNRACLSPGVRPTHGSNGPGRFAAGAEKFDHPYDGDGFIFSVAFRGGRAFLRSRFVRTAE